MAKRRRSSRATDPERAVVTFAALDLRKRPSHRAELGSQLLAGEVVEILARTRDRSWWRVAGPDGYPGWARSWGLAPMTSRQAASWRRRANARVRVPYTVVRRGPGRGGVLMPAYLHARFVPLGSRGGWREVSLPEGSKGWIESRHLALGRTRRSLRALIEPLLGVPYLWGGRTTMGLDCSGFVQMVMMGRNLSLPRDAHDQWLAARRLPRGQKPQAGDLVFFGPPGGRVGHVGILLDRGTYAHARGSVRLNSIEPDKPLYDKDLGKTVRGFGRPSRKA